MKKTILILVGLVLLMASFTNYAKTVNSPLNGVSTMANMEKLQANPGEKLINKSDCIGCHNKVNKIIGPAYLDIARRYKPTAKNIDMLSNKIIKGGTGVWGSMPMSAHPSLKKSDADLMVKYILSLKK